MIRVGVGLSVREVENVLVELELVFKRKGAQFFKRVGLLFLTLLALQIFDVHNFDLATLGSTIFLVRYVFTSPVPTLASLTEFFSAEDQRLHSFLKGRVRLGHVNDVKFYVGATFNVHNTEIKPLCT